MESVRSRTRHNTSGYTRSTGSDIADFQTTKVKPAERQASRGQRAVVDEWEVPRSSGPVDNSKILTKVESRNAVRQHVAVAAEVSTIGLNTTLGDTERERFRNLGRTAPIMSESSWQCATGQMAQDVLSSPVRKRLRRRATIHQASQDRNQESICNGLSPIATTSDQSAARDLLSRSECAPSGPTDPDHRRSPNVSVRISPKASQPFLASALQDDFGAHRPFSMFPDGSSTIPDDTASQQRRLQVALAESERLLLEQMKTSAMLPDKGSSSISSSAFVNTQSVCCTRSFEQEI